MTAETASTGVAVGDGLRVELAPGDRRLVDATGGRLDLAPASLDVLSLTLVDLPRSPVELARELGLTGSGGFVHGVRPGVLEPVDGQWRVAVLTVADPSPAASRIEVGRVPDRAVDRWSAAWGDQCFRVAVFVEATPGFAGVEARLLRGVADGSAPPVSVELLASREELDALPAPPPTAGARVGA